MFPHLHLPSHPCQRQQGEPERKEGEADIPQLGPRLQRGIGGDVGTTAQRGIQRRRQPATTKTTLEEQKQLARKEDRATSNLLPKKIDIPHDFCIKGHHIIHDFTFARRFGIQASLGSFHLIQMDQESHGSDHHRHRGCVLDMHSEEHALSAKRRQLVFPPGFSALHQGSCLRIEA